MHNKHEANQELFQTSGNLNVVAATIICVQKQLLKLS